MDGISWFRQIKFGHSNAFRINNMYNLRQPPYTISLSPKSRDHFILISTSRLCTRSLELCPTLNVNLPLGIRQICRLTSQTDRSFLRYVISFCLSRLLTRANSTVLLSPAFRHGFPYPLRCLGGCSTSVLGNDMYYPQLSRQYRLTSWGTAAPSMLPVLVTFTEAVY